MSTLSDCNFAFSAASPKPNPSRLGLSIVISEIGLQFLTFKIYLMFLIQDMLILKSNQDSLNLFLNFED